MLGSSCLKIHCSPAVLSRKRYRLPMSSVRSTAEELPEPERPLDGCPRVWLPHDVIHRLGTATQKSLHIGIQVHEGSRPGAPHEPLCFRMRDGILPLHDRG